MALTRLNGTSVIFTGIETDITITQNQSTQYESSGVNFYLSDSESNTSEGKHNQSVENTGYLGEEIEVSVEEIDESKR